MGKSSEISSGSSERIVARRNGAVGLGYPLGRSSKNVSTKMDLLLENWIPVRSVGSESVERISLRELLCESAQRHLALPRDDLELAALQLLICITQVLLPPRNQQEWAGRIVEPISTDVFDAATAEYKDWFQLNHPEIPFMQTRGVPSKEATPMDKLLAGLDTSTNSRFVNEPDLATGLCFGCAAIALYNLANNAPSFGGGFKFGLRGSCPVTTFARLVTGRSEGEDLRSIVWMNVLSEESLDETIPSWRKGESAPTWVTPVKEKSTMPAHTIGWLRGLLWQPAMVELLVAEKAGACSCCGQDSDQLFDSFNKAKFSFNVEGLWEHPHSPQLRSLKNGKPETRYIGFTQATPTWTQLSRYLVACILDEGTKKEVQQLPAVVVQQLKRYAKPFPLELLVGGYRNNQAAILERRHDLLTVNHGWENHLKDIRILVAFALKYKSALRSALYKASEGIKLKDRKLKGSGLELHNAGEAQFYRVTESTVTRTLATINFKEPKADFEELGTSLAKTCREIFHQRTSPYLHDPELFRTVAIAKRSLNKDLSEIPNQRLSEEEAAV